MFYYVSGTVAHVEPYLAVIDCGGVGYACKTTSTTISQLQVGKASKLYTYLHVGEGIFDLYGFATQGELGSFKQLIGVSGVGPKAALAILSVCTPQGLAMAVITGDEKALIAAPGIGKKIAQRIILELKDKLGMAIIMITHDLGVVAQNCEYVAIMYAGDIVEQGTHDELLARNGFYADLYNSQFEQAS